MTNRWCSLLGVAFAMSTETAHADLPSASVAPLELRASRPHHEGQVTDTTSASAPSVRVSRFALVMGNNHVKGLEPLDYADDDAWAMHELFVDAGFDSRLLVTFDKSTSDLLKRQSASTATVGHLQQVMNSIRSSIAELEQRGERTELFIYFSGHGDVEGGEGRLLLEDGALTRSQIAELVESTGADFNHVLLDSCSAYLVAARGERVRRRQFHGTLRSVAPADMPRVGIVASTSSDRESHEWGRYGGGIVSHEVRSALRGAADANRDNQVTYAELHAFIVRANMAVEIPSLRPEPYIRPPDGDWDQSVLAWRPDTVSLRVRGGPTGHFYIQNSRAQRVLDAHPRPGEWVFLHFPGWRPLWVRSNDGRRERLVDGMSAEIATALPLLAEPIVSRGREQAAYAQLFALDFGAEHVDELLPKRDVAVHDQQEGFDAGPWERALGYTAIGAATGALALGSLAFVTSLGDGSQAAVDRQNDRVLVERTFAVGLGAAALGAASVWGVLRWKRTLSIRAAPGLSTSAAVGVDGGSLFVEGEF